MAAPAKGRLDAERIKRPNRPEREDCYSTAFGLALRIDPRISIAGLSQSEHRDAATQPPTHIRLAPDELNRRWNAIESAPERTREIRIDEMPVRTVDCAEPAGHLLWARDYGRVLISPDGLELLCDPDPANAEWASIVASQALPLAATLRGLEVMHASGVVVNGGAVLLSGSAGAGKSSLAAALIRVGGQLLSDDAVALQLRDGALIAHAGSVALQLRQAEDERLSISERAALGDPAGNIEGKRRYLSDEAPAPAPLAGMFLLERTSRQPAVERLTAANPFELIASTFNLSVRTPERLLHQLDVVSAIASRGLVHRLRVQPDVDATSLAAIVMEYVA
jgi:hypothetical protein